MNKIAPALAAFLLLVSPVLATEITGTVSKVHDGDTFTLDNGTKIRVFGIDAPELIQQCRTPAGACEPCGRVAQAALSGLLMGKPVTCTQRGKSYKRVVAECSVEGQNISLWMLENGQAAVYGTYLRKGDGGYMQAETKARDAQRGIWGQTFIPMEDWRHHGERLECER